MTMKKMDPSKRKLLTTMTATVGGAGVVGAGHVFVASMLPTREVAAKGVMEVDISSIAPGKAKTILWQGKPVFLVHRTEEQIKAMQATQGGKDPQHDHERVQNPRWLVLIGVCTHLGCVPNTNEDGWFCPCHGSQYDLSGRVLSGPAPRNLKVPPYKFVDEKRLVLGKA